MYSIKQLFCQIGRYLISSFFMDVIPASMLKINRFKITIPQYQSEGKKTFGSVSNESCKPYCKARKSLIHTNCYFYCLANLQTMQQLEHLALKNSL